MSIQVYGQSAGPPVTYPVYHTVWAKRAWADEWTYLPYVECVRCKNTLWPKIPTATFRHKYGARKRWNDLSGAIWAPYNLNDAYIAVWAHGFYSSELLWVGKVPEMTYQLDRTTWLQGASEFPGIGLEYLLERTEIRQTYTEDGVVDRETVFNKTKERGIHLGKNRTTSADVNGIYQFGADENWTHEQIIKYLLQGYAPQGPNWYLGGDLGALQTIVDVVDVFGDNLYRALVKLIDRKRGISARLLTDGTSGIEIHAVSLLDVPLTLGEATLPANSFTNWVDLTQYPIDEASLKVSQTSQFHNVVVYGGPVRTCFTMSYDDATAVKSWTDGSETNYKTALGVGSEADDNDAERGRDRYDPVFTKHRMPDNWDGQVHGTWVSGPVNALPEVNPDGTLDTDTVAPFWRREKVFDRYLPFLFESDEGDPEYRPAFALVQYQVDPSVKYGYVDKMEFIERPVASVRIANKDLAVLVTPSGVNHNYGLNHWTSAEASNIEPAVGQQYDYETLYMTVMLQTDRNLAAWGEVAHNLPMENFSNSPSVQIEALNLAHAIHPIAGPLYPPPPSEIKATAWPPASGTGNGGLVSGEGYRIKRIFLENVEAHYVVPGTIVDVSDGEFQRYGVEWAAATNNLERDDSPIVRKVLATALAWYGRKRAKLSYKAKGIWVNNGPGTLVVGVNAGMEIAQIGTVATEIEWNLGSRAQSTIVSTDYDEPEFSLFTGRR